ncbi:GNAT family N-acetyltransferase [Marivita hallyeonensis]|uniref:Predicted N-acetyltransferase YhbS n=1 Tax=Marivita hallyeonensis TaxID=996342 RepID=A0A1M5XI17_9RHOB|nr:N-acetyltransferase [Marivita hallyeonensis]SHH98903.1 Predicted N-acetyltransferase YhbS [Marivita hallyeonensis]
MEIRKSPQGRYADLVRLFEDTFTASEGPDEGTLIGGLANALLEETSADDIRVFVAQDTRTLMGCAIFTRIHYPEDARTVFILSPMAVATEFQGQGVGTTLLTEALKSLRNEGVDVAITYGDPAYYARVGFEPISEDVAKAPAPLRMPQGWIAQSLSDDALSPLKGAPVCVSALDRPDIW